MRETNRDPRQRTAVRKLIPLSKVQRDRSTQFRRKKNPEYVKQLAEALERGQQFKEDPDVYFDGDTYWVGDGFHRLDAYEIVGREKIYAWVREGGFREAWIHAGGANEDHGLRRTREEMRGAIRAYLADDELGKLSDRTIAKLARCDGKTVASVRAEMGKHSSTRVYTDKHGNETVMNVSGLRGKTAASSPIPINTFHDLPDEGKTAIKEMLRVLTRLSKKEYAFAMTWIKTIPDQPKEAERLLTELEAQEGQGEEMKF